MSNLKNAVVFGLILTTEIACIPGLLKREDKKKEAPYSGATTVSTEEIPKGGGSNNVEVAPAPLSDIEALEAIEKDVSALNPAQAQKTRYFTLHLVNNLGVKPAVLEQQRLAFMKSLNSMSTKTALAKPVAVDKGKLIYRINLDDIGMSPAEFDAVIADHYPFNVQFVDNGTADSIAAEDNDASIRKLLNTDTPVIRMDWWNATATLPIPYAKFMRFPDNAQDFEDQFLGAQVADNVEDDDVIRSGFDNSGVAAANRVVERHDGQNGGFYVTYDFFNLKVGDPFINANGQNRIANQADVDRHNINLRPLGPLGTNDANNQAEFAQDQNTYMFVLPNGLFGYFMANSQGDATDKSRINLIRQNDAPNEFSLAVVNGQSCMSCHNKGLLKTNDTILQGIAANKQIFNAGDLARINLLYQPNAYQSAVDKDNEKYLKVMKEMGIDTNKADPIDASYRFYTRAMTRKDVTIELGVSESDMNLILLDPEFSGTFNALNNASGTIPRANFQAVYAAVIAKFKQDVSLTPPQEADFVVTADCMLDDVEQMDTCVIAPVQ